MKVGTSQPEREGVTLHRPHWMASCTIYRQETNRGAWDLFYMQDDPEAGLGGEVFISRGRGVG